MNTLTHELRVKVVPYEDSHFNSKIVFLDLEESLERMGVGVRSVETRERGRGTPIATRAKIDSLRPITLQVSATIKIENYEDSHFDYKVIIDGLESALEDQGLHISACETRRGGPNSAIAIRASLTPRPSSQSSNHES